MDLEKEREKKQEYLCKEILDKNYDANDFEAFCREAMMTANFGGDNTHVDIDKLEFLELKLIVKNFQRQAQTIDEQKQQNEMSQQAAYEENFNKYQQQNEDQYHQFQEVEDEIEEQQHNIDSQNEVEGAKENQQDTEDKTDNSQQEQISDNKDSKLEQEDTLGQEHQKQEDEQQEQVHQHHDEQEDDLFEKYDTVQGQKQLMSNSNDNSGFRERSHTDLAFEQFQNNLVTVPNSNFTSNIWQMSDFFTVQGQGQSLQGESNQPQGQDPFQYLSLDSFEKKNPSGQSNLKDKNEEAIRKKTLSKADEQKNVQQTQQVAIDKSKELEQETRMRSAAGSIEANQQVEVREKKSSSNTSADSSQLQDIEFQKTMDEFKANDFKTLKQLNIYSGGLQPEVIESNNIVKIQCKKLGQSLISTKRQVNIYIGNTKQVQSGLFGSVQTYYAVSTKPFGWEVFRKLEDFQWLQTILTKMYPGVVIPKLVQPKKIKTEKQEKSRKSFLEHFLNAIIANKDIKNSKFIIDFLSILDEKVFKEKVKESEKFPKPKNIAYILNHDGFVRLDYSKLESKQLDEHLNSYLDVSEGYYNRLKKLSKELMSQLSTVSNTLFEIGSVFTHLHQNTTHFKQQVPSHSIQFDQLLDTYKIMNNINMMQANSIKDQIKLIENHYYHFFKYQKEYNFSIKSISKLKTTMQDEYVKRINSKNMLSSLKKTFSSSSGNESLDIPSKEQEVLKDQIAFYTYQLDKQVTQLLSEKSRSYANEFGMYSNLSQCFQSEMKMFWQDVLKSLEVVKQVSQGKKVVPLKIEMMKKVS